MKHFSLRKTLSLLLVVTMLLSLSAVAFAGPGGGHNPGPGPKPKTVTVTFKVVNGSWTDGATGDKTVQINKDTKLTTAQLPAMTAASGYCPENGSWNMDPLANIIRQNTTFTYTFNCCTPEPEPEPVINYCYIEASMTAGGSMTPWPGTIKVEKYYDQGFTFTAADGFVLTDVLVDGVSVGAVAEYDFENVVKNHTIHAVFTEAGDPPPTGGNTLYYGAAMVLAAMTLAATVSLRRKEN